MIAVLQIAFGQVKGIIDDEIDESILRMIIAEKCLRLHVGEPFGGDADSVALLPHGSRLAAEALPGHVIPEEIIGFSMRPHLRAADELGTHNPSRLQSFLHSLSRYGRSSADLGLSVLQNWRKGVIPPAAMAWFTDLIWHMTCIAAARLPRELSAEAFARSSHSPSL